MTHQEILEKAIQKAIDGGWDPEPYFGTLHPEVGAIVDTPLQYGLIFNHDFAKALWGGREIKHFDIIHLDRGFESETITKPIWQYHLQQMVVASDPIKYLGDHLDD